MSAASFNLHEAKELLEFTIQTNRANIAAGIDTRISTELIGDSGLGKTSAVIQVAEELEMEFVKLNMAQIEEVGDLCGYPIKMFLISNGENTKWVPNESLLPYYKKGWMPTDKRPKMSYAVPDWISGKGKSGILLLDDYSRADIRLLQATMELIDRGQYISWKLPKDWHIILTSNPDDGEFIVNTLDKAQKGRYLSASVHYDALVWAKWAEENQVDSRCINFLLMNEEAVRSEGNPNASDARAWTRFFYAIGHLKNFKSKEALSRINQIGTMAVGAELALTFVSFINGDMDKIPEAASILFSKQVNDALNKLKPLVRPEGQYRADIGSTIGTRLANYFTMVVQKKRKMREGFKMDDLLANISLVIQSEVLGKDMSFSFAQTLIDRHQQLVSPMFGKEELRRYMIK